MSGYGIPTDYDAGEFAERRMKLFTEEVAKFRLKHIGFIELRLDGQQVNVLCIYSEDRAGNITSFIPIAALLTPDEIQRLRNFDGSDKGIKVVGR